VTDLQLNDVRSVLGRSGAALTPGAVAGALRGLGLLVSESTVRETVAALRRESAGAGPLEPLLGLRGVTDVLVNGYQQVYVDRGGGLEQVESPFADEEDVRRLAVRLAAVVGRRLDEGSPFVDARLPDGTRVHAVLGALTDIGTCVSLRVPARVTLTLADWVAGGTMHPRAADLLAAQPQQRVRRLLVGGSFRSSLRFHGDPPGDAVSHRRQHTAPPRRLQPLDARAVQRFRKIRSTREPGRRPRDGHADGRGSDPQSAIGVIEPGISLRSIAATRKGLNLEWERAIAMQKSRCWSNQAPISSSKT